MARNMFCVGYALAFVVVAAAAFACGSGVGGTSPTQDALKVNGKTYSQSDLATRLGIAHAVETIGAGHADAMTSNPSDAQIVDSIVNEELAFQEAERRGLTCSNHEASALEATQVALATSNQLESSLLESAATLGIIPVEYLA